MTDRVKTAWRARADGWIAGRRVKAGEEVSLTAAQAKYEPVDPVEMVAAETAGRTRKVRAAAAGEEAAP
ncbi:hypothetical protein RSWS8N_18194 [Cereibacter sphaeroides WS8N]|uniref:hypothetical protein n=1 Tax=Cereibacter sphaeroides TaxID=1063 RepID=UPI00020B0336|nr:hypothetical protein [Cereibacter sphaeroides]EGJ20117.1 hypothetical protein RSWS8N_18194 [Cereibacter sphaeroides WS8N]